MNLSVHLLALAGIQSHDDLIEHWDIELRREIKEPLPVVIMNKCRISDKRDRPPWLFYEYTRGTYVGERCQG